MKKFETRAFAYELNDYKRLGLNPAKVELWEDGMRTTGEKGSFEWWYFDTTLDNGYTLVIVFYTKNIMDIHSDIIPALTITYSNPNGEEIFSKAITMKAENFFSSKELCDVRIGANRIFGDLQQYTIYIADEDIKAEIKLINEVETYRPGTGFAFFRHNRKENYFAWLPAVPQGRVSGKLTIHGEMQEITGSGYHDHNWGDAMMTELLHHWYWGRAEVGGYTLINSHMVATPKFGNATQDLFIMFKDGKLIGEDPQYVTSNFEDIFIDKRTGKPVANRIIYNYDNGTELYRVIYQREKNLSTTRFVDVLSGIKKWLAKIIRFDGAYLRFTGTVTVEYYIDQTLQESVTSNKSVWELMYFGHVPKG